MSWRRGRPIGFGCCIAGYVAGNRKAIPENGYHVYARVSQLAGLKAQYEQEPSVTDTVEQHCAAV